MHNHGDFTLAAHAGTGFALKIGMGTKSNWGPAVFIFLVTVIGGAYGIFQLWLNSTGLNKEPTDIDVTRMPELREGIVPGTSYSLPDGLYIAKGTNRLFLDKPFPGESTPPVYNPKSRAEYEANPTKWPEIICFLGPKATIRVEQVRRYTCFAYSMAYVIGVVTDGDKIYSEVRWSWPKLNPPLR